MTLVAERWEQAMTPDEYLASLQQYREEFAANIARTRVMPGDWALFGQEPLAILVVTEDWCPDSVQFVPMVIALAQRVPTVEVRILRRSEHQDLADRYRRPDGSQAIPTFVVLDADLQELGVLIERPARADEELREALAAFAREHPELAGVDRPWAEIPPEPRLAVRAFLHGWRAQQFDRWTRYLFEDLAEIAKTARTRTG
ncbi:MAG: thioredoxin family protein [Thermomicrobium sp.]|nr:thioredoxin family protein [Thermomicrobium sp.]MDW8060234.1 thioredoxin family protein [Thermomicrobium sp.]